MLFDYAAPLPWSKHLVRPPAPFRGSHTATIRVKTLRRSSWLTSPAVTLFRSNMYASDRMPRSISFMLLLPSSQRAQLATRTSFTTVIQQCPLTLIRIRLSKTLVLTTVKWSCGFSASINQKSAKEKGHTSGAQCWCISGATEVVG